MKIIRLLSALLLLTIIPLPQARGANYADAGNWKIYSAFDGVARLLDTPSKVYYVSAGQLYAYDKKADETTNYTASGLLSSPIVSEIRYDLDKNKLVVIYADANIDIIDADDTIYNMPDIKDATLSVVPVIYDCAIDGDRLYTATNFGCVIFDINKYEVVTSGDYGVPMHSITIWGDYLLIVDDSARVYYTRKTDKISTLSDLTRVMGIAYPKFVPLSDSLLFEVEFSYNDSRMVVYQKDPSVPPLKENLKILYDKTLPKIYFVYATADGGAFCHTRDELILVGPDGKVTTRSVAGTPLAAKKLGQEYETKQISAYNGTKEMWVGASDGISSYSLADDGTLTVKSEAAIPPNSLTFSKIGRLYTSPSGKVYVGSYGVSLGRPAFVNDINALFHINVIEDGTITDVTPLEFTVQNGNNISLTRDPVGFKSGADFKEDPSDPDAIYVGSSWDGLYRFKNRRQTHKYYSDNSTMQTLLNGYCLRAWGLDFDPRGNLWVGTYVFKDMDYLHMLPAECRTKPTTTAADWSSLLPCINKESGYETQVIACKKSDCVIYSDITYQGRLRVVNTRGTTSTADDLIYYISEFIDQDGKVVTYNYVQFIIEDKKGRLWLGTDSGIFEITNPGAISGNSVRVNHMKVPRNDGSNFADYLLDGESIYWMAVDPSNRKWIATQRSGIYLVSENGDEIIRHFDTTNSPLQHDLVTAVTCGDDNSVYIATASGLVEYKSDSSPAREDFSEVYAYPNPVRPEYTGWITITGLKDNSLVKIADAAGRVFFQGASEGGMLRWDGCDPSGQRVKTGVYYVFASSGGEGQSTDGAVTKIMIVN